MGNFDIFDLLTMIGGLCLFLFGMNIMGQALERRAGSKLRDLLHKLTTNQFAGLLTGLVVTAMIQSSSATTVMVVGFVNSGLMTLRQAINVIMGANVGTTVTAWVLSLSGIDSGNLFVSLLKPSSFTPILALIGIIFYMFCKSSKKKDTGTILLGFATLMFGMETMSDAVSGLADLPQFQQMFLLFQNPILGVLAGAVLTAVIQSSSASVGILQALSGTGQVSYGAAVPIIMGQNIGTCITALLSSVGTNKNAKRAALVHLFFNIIGTTVLLAVFSLVQAVVKPGILNESASYLGIAITHSIFNILCTLILLPQAGILERLVNKLVPEGKMPEQVEELDERLLGTPTAALERSKLLAVDMGAAARNAFRESLQCLQNYSAEKAKQIRQEEGKTDHYEDVLGNYLVKLGSHSINERDTGEAATLLKVIGDMERIADYGINLLESAEEIQEKQVKFTAVAQRELKVLCSAVDEVLNMTLQAFEKNDSQLAASVEPLEEVVDALTNQMRTRHILRMQKGRCSISAGFVWSDLLTSLERVSDHCSNIAASVINLRENHLLPHASIRALRRNSSTFEESRERYAAKYQLPDMQEAF